MESGKKQTKPKTNKAKQNKNKNHLHLTKVVFILDDGYKYPTLLTICKQMKLRQGKGERMQFNQ